MLVDSLTNQTLKGVKNQAKKLLQAKQNNDPSCLPVLRLLTECSNLSDQEILSSDLPLQKVQHAIALYHKFENWAELKKFLEEKKQKANKEDPLQLEIEFIFDMNSFIACLASVLGFWKEPVSTSYIAGLTGDSFAPIYNTGEDCTAWWLTGAEATRVNFLEKALGFRSQLVYNDPDNPKKNTHFLQSIKQALEAGNMVLLHTWPSWSILSGWSSSKKEIPFATYSWAEEMVKGILPPFKCKEAFILTRKEKIIPYLDVYKQAFAFGTDIATGNADLDRKAAGIKTYEICISNIEKGYFCPICKKASGGCLQRTIACLHSHYTHGSAFLSELETVFHKNDLAEVDLKPAVEMFKKMEKIISEYKSISNTDFNEKLSSPSFKKEIKQVFITLKELHLAMTKQLKEQCLFFS